VIFNFKITIFQGKSQAGDSDVIKRLQSQIESLQKELEKSKDEASRSQTDMERLLQVVQMGQEEQNAKEKQIRELQEYVHITNLNFKFMFKCDKIYLEL